MVLIPTQRAMELGLFRVSFRPLAGIMVLINKDFAEKMERVGLFPSPCGDYGSYLITSNIYRGNKHESFRPLAGIMVLIDWQSPY